MKKSILVVDDSQDMLALEKMILEGDGFEVYTAQTADAAFRILDEVREPSLIILDQQLEEMSGDEFLEKLEKKNPELIENVPVVILSGAKQNPNRKAAGYIHKFPDISVFLQQVHQFIGERNSIPVNSQKFEPLSLQPNEPSPLS
jgi:CheY-like chemotaxis protein